MFLGWSLLCRLPWVPGISLFHNILKIPKYTKSNVISISRSGKVREKCAEKVRESQGIQIELTGGNPEAENWNFYLFDLDDLDQ